jgi:hypothetical protein
MGPFEEISREEALLWLNDRLGKEVDVVVFVGAKGDEDHVLYLSGDLRYEKDGVYGVGGATLDIRDLHPVASFSRLQLKEGRGSRLSSIRIGLGENAFISITQYDKSGE